MGEEDSETTAAIIITICIVVGAGFLILLILGLAVWYDPWYYYPGYYSTPTHIHETADPHVVVMHTTSPIRSAKNRLPAVSV